MEYRVKKVTYVDDGGNKKETYYPQHRHWWCPWWHYFGIDDVYGSHDSFGTFGEAVEFIKTRIRQEKEHRVEYIGVDYVYLGEESVARKEGGGSCA